MVVIVGRAVPTDLWQCLPGFIAWGGVGGGVLLDIAQSDVGMEWNIVHLLSLRD